MNKKGVDEAYWRKHKESWKNSGLSQRGYSKQEGLCNKKFNYHIKKLDKQSGAEDFKFIEAAINILRAYPKNRWHSPIQVDTGLYLNTNIVCTRLKIT